MKFENELAIIGAIGYIKAILKLLEIEDDTSEVKLNEVKIKYLKEAISDIKKAMEDESESSTS